MGTLRPLAPTTDRAPPASTPAPAATRAAPVRAASSARGAAIIEVRDLVKVYGGGKGPAKQEEVRAVDGVSFTVREGEFFGFLGPNGAGKSTIIKVITTLLAPTGGSVRVAGLDPATQGAAIRKVIGYTGQSVGVDGELTGRENLTLIGHLYHMPAALIAQRVEELLRVLELQEAADRPANTYSGGMRRRLDLGAGLVHHPRILFLDEPTTGLDPHTRNGVWEYLRKLHEEQGMTIFLTTQYLEEADRLCDRLAIIDHGKLVAEGSPAALKAGIGADVVTVRIARDERFEANRARALAVAQKARGVRKAMAFDEGVSLHAADGSETLLDVMRLMDAEGLPVQQVAVARPTLDEVFLQHTGRQMRVEEVRPASRAGFGQGRR